MAIRKFIFLSLVAAGAAQLGVVSSAVAQQAGRLQPAPTPEEVLAGSPEQISSGLIMSADDFQLGPGETVVSGDPGFGIRSGTNPATGYPYHDAARPGELYGSEPVLAPPPGYGLNTDCPGCESIHYVAAEALYFRHDGDGSLRRSTLFNVGEDELDYEWAGRLTIGRRFDCVNGYEAIYAGPLKWEDTAPGERFQADLNSLEFNRTYFGWDVVKALIGIRTMLYDEELINGDFIPAVDDFLTQHTDNFLIGPQIGLELYYPLANRVSIHSKLKGGLLLNFYDSDTRLFFADPDDNISVDDDDTEITGFGEIGTMLTYQLTDSITAAAGYELWYLSGVATAYDRAVNLGSSPSADEDVLIHGATAGIEIAF